MANIVSVVINRLARNVDKEYHYLVSDELFLNIDVGSLVFVPFGKGDGLIEAFVVGFPLVAEVSNLKEIAGIKEAEPFFDRELLEVAYYMKDRYFSTLISAIKTIAPPGIGVHFDKTNEKIIKGACLKVSFDEAFSYLEDIREKAPMQTRILELMIQNDFVAYSDIMLITGCTRNSIKALEEKGILAQSETEVYRNPIDYDDVDLCAPPEPTDEQSAAIEKITEANHHKTFLLHGVTGSGKTEVFLSVIQNVIEKKKTAIVLVPEISLTPQTVKRFVSRFGKKVAILHSKLSPGERADEYKRIKKGEVDVVIGVRSAIFAPLPNLGIIIIDEEHEPTYKSENIPCYDAREVGIFRATYNNIPLVLSSATPDVTSFYMTEIGRYELLSLKSRVNKKALPDATVVDMRQELANGNRSILSSQLRSEIEKNIKNKEQTILFLNRRGFSSFVSCRNCGYTIKCKRCNVSLTYHKNNESLTCHYCGYTIKNPTLCPECKSSYIKQFGTGTQRAEEEISHFFPEASVIRMDVDTTSAKMSHQKILDKFQNEKVDILIGTQMVAKGLDFPSVTLVGVLAADLSLNNDDFKAGERTFDLITQVCGRAGRGEKKGRAIIQTYSPENTVIKKARAQDYISFYYDEINLRKSLNYPPFSDIISIVFSSASERAIEIYSKKMKNYILHAFSVNGVTDAEIYGPSACKLAKINSKYRWQILIKCRLSDVTKKIINNFISSHYKQRENKWISMTIELNPNSIN